MFAPGANNRPKSPIDNALGKLWRVVAQTENFVKLMNHHTWKAGRLCKTIPQNGVKVAPLGAGATQICPIDFLWLKTLTPRSSESGFHRNVKFATFEEAAGSVRPYLKMG